MKRKMWWSFFLATMLILGIVGGNVAYACDPDEGCDGDTFIIGGANGKVTSYLEANNYTPWVDDPVHVTGYLEIDAFAWAFSYSWSENWEDWYWSWESTYKSTWACAYANTYAFSDFWWWVEGVNPDGSTFLYDDGYAINYDWDWDWDLDWDGDLWYEGLGDDISAEASAVTLVFAPTSVKIPIDFTIVPKKPGVFTVTAHGDSFVSWWAKAGFCTEFGCFGYDEDGEIIFIFDEATLKILARIYPAVPTGRFDVVDAPGTVIQAYRLDEGVSLQPWLGGNHTYALEVEDSNGDGQWSTIHHTHGGTTIILWSYTDGGGHSAYASYDYFGPMGLSGWQETIWKDGNSCWTGEGGYLLCPKIPTDQLINAFLKYDPNVLTRDIREDYREAMRIVYGMQLELEPDQVLSTAGYEAAVVAALNN